MNQITSRYNTHIRFSGGVRIDNHFLPFAKHEVEQSITRRFAAQASKYPDKIAIETKNITFSYRQLDRTSSRIANAIIAEVGYGEEPVAVLAGEVGLQIASMLGTLKAGKFYIPIDTAHVNSRDKQILQDCGARLLITDGGSLELVKGLAGEMTKILVTGEISEHILDEAPGVTLRPDSPAYVLYTSGSTGKPKGVMQTHRNVLHNIMKYTNGIHISPDDRMSLVASCSVGASVSDIYGALLNGASLYPIDLRRSGLEGLVDWLIERQITIYHSVPSVFRYLAARLAEGRSTPTLRLIKLGGEPIFSKDFELYKKYFPDDCIFHVGLGATEMNIIRQLFLDKQSDPGEGIVPVGYEVDETEVLLLDKEARPAADGSIGEIVIRSRYLPASYYRSAETKETAFRADPDLEGVRIYRTGDIGYILPDGCLVCLGRKDSQVKIRGHRVETAEVELSLLKVDKVKEAVVTSHHDHRGTCRLTGHVVVEIGSGLSAYQLRSYLKQLLPNYMIPSSLILLEELPRTAGGKVDRERLRYLATVQQDSEGDLTLASNSIEEQLIHLWQEILSVKPVGVRDDFFDLGGDSLSAADLFAEIEELFGRKLSASTLLHAPTIQQLAKIVENERDQSSLVLIKLGGSSPALFFVHGIGGDVLSFRELAGYLNGDQPIYGLRAQGAGVDRFSVESIAAHYVNQMRRVQPDSPYFLAGYSFGGTVAFEIARQLVAQDKQVGLLALFDTHGPGYPRLLPVAKRMVIHSRNLLRADHAAKLSYLRDRFKINVIRIKKNFRKLSYRSSMKLRGEPPAAMEHSFQAAHQQASSEYIPKCYHGRLTLFRAHQQSEIWQKDFEMGWGGLAAGGVEVHEVPGNHVTLIVEPNVRTLAERFSECLHRARAMNR